MMNRGIHNQIRVSEPESGRRQNNFGLLRLILATLVIVSHSPEMVDGDRTRELLTRCFGTITFGAVGVDGFFLISGYLITKSYVENRHLGRYLLRRSLRIIPGYLVCFWICVLLLAPMVGAGSDVFSAHEITRQLGNNMLLLQPDVRGCFATLHFPMLNGSMWTISYEFAFYIATALLGLMGLYKPRYRSAILALALLTVFLHGYGYTRALQIGTTDYGITHTNIRLAEFYLAGSLFYLFADKIRLTHVGAAIAVTMLIPLMFRDELAELAVMTLGGYLIFWFALRVPALRLGGILKADISYGLYLYAWPIQNLLIWSHPGINPWLLCVVSLALAASCGYLSWTLIEKPALEFRAGSYLLAVRRKRAFAS